jgi:hypothetical protein
MLDGIAPTEASLHESVLSLLGNSLVRLSKVISTGKHELVFKLVASEMWASFGLMLASSTTDGAGDGDHAGRWCMHCFLAEARWVASDGAPAEINPKVPAPNGSEIRMEVDMDQGTATFFVGDTKLGKTATGISGPVYPFVSSFADRTRIELLLYIDRSPTSPETR